MVKRLSNTDQNGTRNSNVPNPSADGDSINRGYITARGPSLVTNWTGALGSNYNFSSFTFRGDKAPPGSSGSFEHSGGGTTKFSDEFIPINPNKVYRLDAALFPENQSPVEKQYVGLSFWDADGNNVQPLNHMYTENNEVYLSRPFTPGTDTKMYLTADPGWSFNGTQTYTRGVIFWGYTSASGIEYPAFTYSRDYVTNIWAQSASSLATFNGTDWEITVNTTSLGRAGMATGTLPAGRRVSRSDSAGLYKYITAENYTPENNTWNYKSGYIGGLDTSGRNKGNSFPPGTSSARLLFLANYAGVTAGSKILFSGLYFNETESKLLGPAITLGAGTWYDLVDSATVTDSEKTRTATKTVARSGDADYLCDGVADEVQIQQAIDAVAAAGGGIVYLRTGIYRIAATINIPFDAKIRVVGEKFAKGNTGGTILQTATSVNLTNMFSILGTTSPSTNAGLTHDISFENLTINGNLTTTNNFYIANADYVKFDYCRIISATNSIKTVWDSTSDPVAATVPGGLYISNCIISANSGIGLDLQYQTQCWITDSWFSGTSVATWVNFKSCNKIHVSNCEFNTATTALRFQDSATVPTTDITVNDCVFAGGKAWTEERTHANSNRVSITGYTQVSGTNDTLVGTDNVTLGTNGGKIKSLSVIDQAYGAGWDGSLEVPTKNAVYDVLATYQNKTTVSIGSSNADYITDGTADNVQLQAAIDATTSSTGVKVITLVSDLVIATTVTLKSNIILDLAGHTISVANATNVKGFITPTGGATNLTIKNGTIDGNGANQTAGDVLVDLGANGGDLINVFATDLVIKNSFKHAIFIHGASAYYNKGIYNSTVQNHGVGGIGYGIYTDYSPNTVIAYNTVRDSNGNDSIEIGHQGQVVCHGNYIEDGDIQFPFGDNSIISDNILRIGKIINDTNTANGMTITGNQLLNATVSTSGYAAIRVHGAKSRIADNYVYTTVGDGIKVENGDDHIISGNHVETDAILTGESGILTGTSASNVVITNNKVNNFDRALRISWDHIIIANNQVINATKGVELTASTTSGHVVVGADVHDNDLSGATTAIDKTNQASATNKYRFNDGDTVNLGQSGNKLVNVTDPTAAQDAATKAYVDTVKTVYNVKDYGAKGDGTTNDSTAIQATITAAAGVGEVFIPAGMYRIGTTINIPSNTTVRGAGRQKTILRYATGTVASTNLMALSSGTVREYNILIEKLTLDAQDQVDKGLANFNGVVTDLTVRDCEFINMNCTGTARWGLRIGTIIDADIEGTASFNVDIHHNLFKNNNCNTFEVILLPNVRDSWLHHNNFEDNSTTLTDEVSIYGFNINLKYHHNVHKNWSDYAVGAKESDQVEITDNIFTNTDTGAAGAVRFFNQINGKVANNNMLFAVGSTTGGIALRDYNTGRDGHVQRNPNSYNLDLSGNIMTNVYYGIHNFTSAASNFAYHDINIDRNEFYACSKAAVRIGPNTTPLTMSVYNIFVKRNHVYGWSGNIEGAISFYGDTADATKMTKLFIEDNFVADNTTGASSGGIRLSAVIAEVVKDNYIISTGSYGALSFPNSGSAKYVSNNIGLNPIYSYSQGSVTGATTFNRKNGETILATLTGNVTATITAGATTGDKLTLILTQDATGSRTITWPTNFKKAGGVLLLSTAANSVDTINMQWDGTNWRETSRSMGLA